MSQNGQPGRGSASPALVVKVGGSLLSHIPRIVPVLIASPRPLLVVPGGGIFADAVRQAGVNDDAAHWMAIAAMEQYGWVLASQGMATTRRLAHPGKPCVLLPYCVMRRLDPLPHTWDITSDTIAAWVAGTLGAELLILKSVDGIRIDGILQEAITEPVASDVVDPCFIPYVLDNRIKVKILNGTQPELLERYLRGEKVQGTVIGTDFGTTF